MNQVPSPQWIAWARKMHELDALVLDTETTGGAFYDEIIDLAVVKAKTGEIVFNQLFKPCQTVNPHAFRVHGIRDMELQSASGIIQFSNELEKILHNRIIIAYNSAFDSRLLEQTFNRYDLKTPNMTFFCAMAAYKQYRGGQQLSLTEACREMRVTKPVHTARLPTRSLPRELSIEWRTESRPTKIMNQTRLITDKNQGEEYIEVRRYPNCVLCPVCGLKMVLKTRSNQLYLCCQTGFPGSIDIEQIECFLKGKWFKAPFETLKLYEVTFDE